MKDPLKPICTDISVLQSKLGLLRAELLRKGEQSPERIRELRQHMELLEREIDQLQAQFGRKKLATS